MVMGHPNSILGVTGTAGNIGHVRADAALRRPQEASTDGGARKKDDFQLMKACLEFEGIFLSMLFRAMMNTTGAKDQGPYGTIAEQAFGQKMAEAGGIGLAKVLFNSLAKSSPEIQRRR
ncbi:MAG TPA: hypothetical protein GX510_04855 [Firmicutes bacterium]|nr:hypothetical protein [Candidatus Fermentithermobacillaceae bacterium]